MAKRLTRNSRNAVVAGVAAGFADYFDLDPVIPRLAFVFLALMGGSGVVAYILCWVIMPVRDSWSAAEAGPSGASAAPGTSPAWEGGVEPASGSDAPGPAPGGEPATVADRVAREAGAAGERIAEAIGSARGGPTRGRVVGGIVLIGLGCLFLVDRLLPIGWWVANLWPVALILLGLAVVFGARRGNSR
jgi:phage shock protein PspC (stress-responsive transcriptional regulator)